MALELSKVATVELLREIQRRVNCAEKPEKYAFGVFILIAS